MARSYYTKADLIDFAKHIVSDERRLRLQIECREKLKAGTINPIPWSIAERIVTEEDFREWKTKKQ